MKKIIKSCGCPVLADIGQQNDYYISVQQQRHVQLQKGRNSKED